MQLQIHIILLIISAASFQFLFLSHSFSKSSSFFWYSLLITNWNFSNSFFCFHIDSRCSSHSICCGGGLSFESGDGESKLKVAGRIQLDYRDFDTGNGSSANSKAADGFDVRRAYLGVAGTANKYYGYKF